MLKDPTIPTFSINTENQIDITIAPTQTQIEEQGYIYNQAGFTYNQPGVFYGGVVRQNQDIAPIFTNDTAGFINPSIMSIIDTYTLKPAPNNQKVVGIGWWMYIAQV